MHPYTLTSVYKEGLFGTDPQHLGQQSTWILSWSSFCDCCRPQETSGRSLLPQQHTTSGKNTAGRRIGRKNSSRPVPACLAPLVHVCVCVLSLCLQHTEPINGSAWRRHFRLWQSSTQVWRRAAGRVSASSGRIQCAVVTAAQNDWVSFFLFCFLKQTKCLGFFSYSRETSSRKGGWAQGAEPDGLASLLRLDDPEGPKSPCFNSSHRATSLFLACLATSS